MCYSMQAFTRSLISIVVLVTIFGAGCASSESSELPIEWGSSDLPENLRVAGPVDAHVQANGFQVYTCTADSAGKLSWTLKGPDATFVGTANFLEVNSAIKGKHYASPTGPTWESTIDGSKVVGKKIAEHESDAVDAVPWLLLVAVSHEGSGVLSSVTYIQRINTSGGKAPTFSNAKAGDEVKVPYTAEYIFYDPIASTGPSVPRL